MPDREQRAGQRGQRAKVDFPQRGGKSGVLHSHLDRQRAAGGFVKAKQPSAPVAAEQADGVMQDDGDNHHKAYGSDMRCGTGHHGADNRQNADHRKGRQERLHRLHHFR